MTLKDREIEDEVRLRKTDIKGFGRGHRPNLPLFKLSSVSIFLIF